MARRILIITVGGSCEPIVTTIQNHQPDLVYFLCSKEDKETNQKSSRDIIDGEGLVCGGGYSKPHDKYNIVKQTNLSSYEIIEILEIDNLDECFNIFLDLLKHINGKYKDANIISDYTAGTKSMSSALVLASTHFGNVNISLVKGVRNNLQKTLNNTQFAVSVKYDSIRIEKELDNLKILIANFNYSSSCLLLENILKKYGNIDKTTQHKLQKCLNIFRAFDYWDKFNHLQAYELINLYKKDYLVFNFFMEALISERKMIDDKFEISDDFKPKNHHFELVHDLILNAERRAKQNRFDDAVARLYRALELFVQIYLKKKYDILSSNLDILKLPENIRQQYELKKDNKGKIKIGLMESYELVTIISDNPLGKSFVENKSKIFNKLEVRNQSILAHGFKPVSEVDYQEVYNTFVGFIKINIESLKKPKNNYVEITQFPNEIATIFNYFHT